MAKRNKNELRVGLFLLIPVVALLLIIMLKLGYSVASSTMDVYLKVNSLTSVKNGTSVIVKGYAIGRVVEIKPVFKPELHFLAKMRINRDIELYEDCSAIIQNQNVLGDPSIEIRNPEIRQSLLLDGDVLEGIEYSGLNAILKDVHEVLSKLSVTLGGVNEIMGDSRRNLQNLTANLASSSGNLTRILDDSQKDIVAMLKSFRATALTMQEISEELKKHPVKFLFKDGKD
jgi:ABC-type transporter Mla subunit MlaD